MKRSTFEGVAIGAIICSASVWAQEDAPTLRGVPVRTTAVIELAVRPTLMLTGSVEAPRSAVIASEVEGVVAEMPAREGLAIERGAPLVRLGRRRIALHLESAEGRLAEARARLKLAEQRLERTRELSSSLVVSEQQVDDAIAESQAWAGRVREIAADVEGLRRDLDNTVVRAPFAGVVGKQEIEVGEWLGVGDPVVELISVADLEVRLEVPEQYFGELVVGVAVEVAYGSGGSSSTVGVVRAVVPRADPTSRTFPVLVRLMPADESLRIGAGMLATVRLPIGDPISSRLVPKDAILTAGSSRFIYVLDENSATVERVEVTMGAGIGAWTVVSGSLVAVGRSVVTRGNERLSDGAVVAATLLEYPIPDPAGE